LQSNIESVLRLFVSRKEENLPNLRDVFAECHERRRRAADVATLRNTK